MVCEIMCEGQHRNLPASGIASGQIQQVHLKPEAPTHHGVTGNPVKQIPQRPKVLLLQGPVGPFFSDLYTALLKEGFSARRVTFNAGDHLFAPHEDCVRFSGDAFAWETWLRFEFAQNTPDAIVFFGANRPAHNKARHLAKLYGIDVLSLEEGYLRSGYVSCEMGGNNEHSPLVNWRPKPLTKGGIPDPAPASDAQPSSYATMGFWAAAYYLVRDFASKPSAEHLFHRKKERIAPLTMSWGVHLLRRLAARITEFPARQGSRRWQGYLLIPLQVAGDSQLQGAARGWSTSRLIDASLTALRASPVGQRVVFKLHPLERKSARIKRQIIRRADELGVDLTRFRVLHSGRIGDLTKQSSGMVVINSTSAFSALHHNIPILVLGEAVFRHHTIVTLGETEEDVTAFFKLRHAKSHDHIKLFFAEIKSQSLIPGDFYVSRGRRVAISGIIHKLQQLQCMSRPKNEVTT